MLQVHDKELFHDDGTPRRKYEIETTADPRIVFRASIAVAVTSSVIFLKNVLFGSGNARLFDHSMAEPFETPPHRAIDDDVFIPPGTSHHNQPDDEDEGKKPDELDHEHVKFKLQYSSSIMDVGIFGKPLTLPKKANDNVPLYSAPAGAAAQFPFFETPLMLAGHVAGGDGNGASGTSSSPPPGTVVGDNDDIDDPVRNANRRPYSTGMVSLGTLVMNSAILLTVTDLLKKVIDPDGDKLRIADLSASSGTLKLNSDGVWAFTPDTNDTTDVKFTYRVTDGQYDVLQTAFLDLVQPDTMKGTERDDEIIGTPQADVIDALGGNDVIVGREGDDVILGGDGDDRILAGDGNDVVYAGAGNDFVLAGAGDDTVYGGAGDDVIFGEDGRDTLFGDAGNDWLDGGAGNDVLDGGEGNDRIDGGADNDIIRGGAGNDAIDDGIGDDYVEAGDDDDEIQAVHLDQPATSSSEDTDGLSADPANIATPASSHSQDTEGSLTNPADIETSATSQSQDTDEAPSPLTLVDEPGPDTTQTTVGSPAGPTLLNAAETSTIQTTIGSSTSPGLLTATITDNDVYDGSAGNDTYNASKAKQAVSVDLTAGTASGSEVGQDTLISIENVSTGAGNDDVVGSSESNVIKTGAGDDEVDARDGDDTVELGKGNDTYVAHDDDGDDHVDGGAGSGDTLDYSATTTAKIFDLDQGTVTDSDNSGSGSSGSGSSGSGNSGSGSSGSGSGETDIVTGFEYVKGGSGNDTFIASDDVNEFWGGDGDDLFVFVSADRIGSGRGGRDKILDFDVGDRIDFDEIAKEIEETTGQDFRFVLLSGGAQFSRPGELRLDYEDFEESRVVVLDGNLDWDNNSEFQLEFTGDLETLDKLLADIFGRDATT